VAASTYGGWLRYSSFNAEWLQGRLQRGEPLYKLLNERWPFLSVSRLPDVPADLCLCVGWTGEPAATGPLIERVRHLRDRDPLAYGDFLADSHRAVDDLVTGIVEDNPHQVLDALSRNRQALADLGSNAGVAIETSALHELNRWAEICGGAAKPSGAGGGDCGIALIFGEQRAKSLEAAWHRVNLEPLRLQVAPQGVEVVALDWS
jgi:phosphomevalonate kinase